MGSSKPDLGPILGSTDQTSQSGSVLITMKFIEEGLETWRIDQISSFDHKLNLGFKKNEK